MPPILTMNKRAEMNKITARISPKSFIVFDAEAVYEHKNVLTAGYLSSTVYSDDHYSP